VRLEVGIHKAQSRFHPTDYPAATSFATLRLILAPQKKHRCGRRADRTCVRSISQLLLFSGKNDGVDHVDHPVRALDIGFDNLGIVNLYAGISDLNLH